MTARFLREGEGAIREKFVGSDALRSLNGIDKAAQPGNLSFFDFKVKVGQRGQPSRAERLNRTLGLPSSPFDIEVAVTVLVENGGQGGYRRAGGSKILKNISREGESFRLR